MKLFHPLFFFIPLFITAGTLRAQSGDIKLKDLQEINKREMIVIVEKPNSKIIDRLKKKNKTSDIEKMEKMYDAFNGTVKQIVEKHWKPRTAFNYMTREEFKNIDSKEKYAIMHFMSKRASVTDAGYIRAGYTILQPWMDDENDVENHDLTKLFQTFIIDKAENVNRDNASEPIYSCTLPELYPTAVSVFFAIKNTQSVFNKKLAGEKQSSSKSTKKELSNKLKNKTLVFRKDWIANGLSEEKIKEIYKYPLLIVDDKKLDEIIKSEDSTYAFFCVCPTVISSPNYNSILFFQYCIDNLDGSVLGLYMPSAAGMMFGPQTGIDSGQKQLTEKSLKGFVKNME